MREETSPPREPSPPAPSISIITSPPAASPPPPSQPASTTTTSVQLVQDNRPSPYEQRNGAGVQINITAGGVQRQTSPPPPQTDTAISSSPIQTSNQKTCVKIIDRTKNEQTSLCDCASEKDTLSVKSAGRRLRQGSSHESSSSPASLSRDSSTEHYTDCTGIDLHQFIIDTLNKNAKDRVMMLKIEQELVTLAKDKSKTHYKFPAMSSYQRMLVHRCAAYFGMEHNIETSGKCVVVNKTKNTRVPERRFREHIREDLPFGEEPRRSILKRDSSSFEDCRYKSPERGHGSGFESRRSKSFEEREEEYEKARRRIFKDGTVCRDPLVEFL